MHFKDDSEIEELVRTFETCELNPAEFKHCQHLAVALWYVRNFPYEEAGEKMRQGIQRLAAAYGKTGYHETITIFWLKVVRAFYVNERAEEPLFDIANRLADQCGNKNLIADYYSEERIASVDAKHGWVEPDLKPFAME